MTKQTEKQKRVEWIDFAKGITILLTIVGHSVTYGMVGNVVRGMIFSFHMPLFFILSMVTYKCATDGEKWKSKAIKASKHLLLPAIFVFVAWIVWQCAHDRTLLRNLGYWKGEAYALLFASGVDANFEGMQIAAIGIPWFFFALLFGRTIFDFLHLHIKNENVLLIVSVIVGMQGMFWGKTQWLPFSLDIALAIMPFLFFGNCVKKMQIGKKNPVIGGYFTA